MSSSLGCCGSTTSAAHEGLAKSHLPGAVVVWLMFYSCFFKTLFIVFYSGFLAFLAILDF